MKNKISVVLILITFILINFEVKSEDQFNFDVTEIQIIENGNIFIGNNKGTITSSSGVVINAEEFEYNKKLNLLKATGNVEVHDEVNDYFIFSNKITYDKNKELITSKGKSKAISSKDDIKIYAESFEYFTALSIISAYENVLIDDKKKQYNLHSDYIKYFLNKKKIFSKGNSKLVNLEDQTTVNSENLEFDIVRSIINANKNVLIENREKNYKIISNNVTYFKNKKKFETKDKTFAELKSEYEINSSNVTFLQSSMEIFSEDKTSIKDKFNVYNTSRFIYYIEKEFLKAEDIVIISNYKKPQNDKYFFKSGMFDLKRQNFIAGETEINIHKNIFGNLENDPRIVGLSSARKGDITTINKGIFTSCKKNDDCPPWAIEASQIKHNQIKREMHYKNAVLKVYNVPVLYFPKFFHPDPTVKRRSGILQPTLNESNVLGSSLTIPYYHVISEQSDLTLAPTIFDAETKMLQSEYRKVNKNSNILINLGHERDYKSVIQNKKKNTSYIFSEMNFDLNFNNFNTSKIDLKVEKVTDDSFLKVFNTNLIDSVTSLKPKDNNIMKSEFVLTLDHEKYNLTTGFSSYENLQKNNHDRYEYVLPYYNLNKTIVPNLLDGSLSLNSNGSNVLNNTNQLLTKITNNLSYSSLDYFTSNGLKNNFNINLKNLNSVGENVSGYKSSPRSEISSLFEVNSILPLKKKTNRNVNYLTPKVSLRFNPSDMKNHQDTASSINAENIFTIDRFGLSDSYEAGQSITLGIDYKSETLEEMNKYFEMKLATVFRDKEENFIPSKTTLNKKTSNIFGSMSTNFIEKLNLKYKFAIDNNLDEIEYNDVGATISLNKFTSEFNFLKETNDMGNESFLKNTTTYEFDDKNSITFNTRRNRKINLTEFYDLVYEYKNDCLVAGLKYKKSYYEDKDLKPTEDLMFTITFIPLTTYEQKIEQFN